ncbi:MAG: PDZ domain-containing protein [Pirellulales bacterium]
MHTLAPRTAPRFNSYALLVAGLTAAAVWAGVAVATAADSDQPARRSHLEPVGDVEVPQTAGDLGLRLSRASAVLRQQLALDRGAGLVVDDVTPASPAYRAGFRQHDVLVKLDDQMLVLPEQFNALLEATAGAACTCHVLRAGRIIEVPLGAPAAPVAAAAVPAAGGRPAASLRPSASTLSLLPQSQAAGPRPARPAADETLVRQDADYQIRLVASDEKRLVVTDAKGRVVFNDAIDTPEGRSRMPLAVRARVEQMERLLERPAATRPVAEIGRLDTVPIEIR